MSRPVLVFLLFLACAAQVVPQTPSPPNPAADVLKKKLEARMQDIAARLDGVMSYVVVDLTNRDRFVSLPDVVSPTASTIKLAILYEFFRQVDEGKVKPDEPRRLDRRSAVGGSGVLFELGTPTLSLADYAMLMILLSDNTATNVVIDSVGMDAVNARMRSLGLERTRLRRHMMDAAAARRGDENVSTAAEIARLLEVLYRGEGLTPASRDRALKILKTVTDDKVRMSPLLQGLPPGIEAASKPGDLEGVHVDAGIVFAKNRPYIYAAMTTYLQEDAAGAAAITEASRAAYGYFSRRGAGTEYGRQIGR